MTNSRLQDLTMRLSVRQEEQRKIQELRKLIENHIIMSEDFKAEYESWLDSLNEEVKDVVTK